MGGRHVAQGRIVSQADTGEDAADDRSRHDGERDGCRQTAPSDAHLRYQLAADAEPGKEARSQQGEDPRIDELERRQERLGASRQNLAGHTDDGRDEQQAGHQSQPEHAGRPSIASDKRGPDDRSHGQEEWQRGRHADQQIDGAARPVAEENDATARGPENREGDGEEPKLELADTHAGSLAGPGRRAKRPRAKATQAVGP